ncbi:hypothetical protein ACVINH_001136 [Rhizobium anhuiense]
MASFFVKAQLLPTGHDPEDIDGFTLNGESNAQASFEADDPQAIPNLAPNRSSLWKALKTFQKGLKAIDIVLSSSLSGARHKVSQQRIDTCRAATLSRTAYLIPCCWPQWI